MDDDEQPVAVLTEVERRESDEGAQLEAQAPLRFFGMAFEGNSLLVTFELSARGEGTLLRMTETGFREKGWEVAVLEQQYREHGEGWDYYLPRLSSYAPTVSVPS